MSEQAAGISVVHVGRDGIRATATTDDVLDVLFDGRRIWSFWVIRDGERDGNGYLVPWPAALTRFLDGTTRLTVTVHVDQRVLHEEEIAFGTSTERIAVVNDEGKPLGIDKSNRLAQTFDTRSSEHVAPLLDSMEEVLAALKKAGIDAFPAYGTLLGAVRDGRLIGHDSDADLGYVSDHSHPVDVVRESFVLQRRLAEMGYQISRYSGAAFKVDVTEGDGSTRGLDVFGGFLTDGYLVLMGEIRTPFEREWIFPLGETTLEGRTFPAPADTDRFLAATYGASWRVPDPAFHFETPNTTHRRLNGWFRGTRVRRQEWDRAYGSVRKKGPAWKPSALAELLHEREPDATEVIDVGCGRGADAFWLARQGVPSIGLDFAPGGFEAISAKAKQRDIPLEFHAFNLLELRQVLGWGARVARTPGPRAILARHVADATDRHGRAHLWRFAEMALRDGGRLYLEFLTSPTRNDRWAERMHLHRLQPELVIAELEGRGARIVQREDLVAAQSRKQEPDSAPRRGAEDRRTCRMVVEWVS